MKNVPISVLNKFHRTFFEQEYTATELRDKIQQSLSQKTTLENEIPDNVIIGPFKVNVYNLKNILTTKQSYIAINLMKMHEKRLKKKILEILNEFQIIEEKLSIDPTDIEQLFEMREWMETVPINVSTCYETLRNINMEYDILDGFNWNLSDEDFNAKWETMKFPKLIQKLVSPTISHFFFPPPNSNLIFYVFYVVG